MIVDARSCMYSGASLGIWDVTGRPRDLPEATTGAGIQSLHYKLQPPYTPASISVSMSFPACSPWFGGVTSLSPK